LHEPIDEFMNFQKVYSAILVLLQTITGDNWHEVFFSVQKGFSLTNQCISNPTHEDFKLNNKAVGCGLFTVGLFYFFTFIVICMLVLLNLFIAIILIGYEETRAMLMNDYNINVQEDF